MSKQGRNRDRRQKGGQKRGRGGRKREKKNEKSFNDKERRETNTVWRRGTYKKGMGVIPSEGRPWSALKQALDPPTHPKKVAVR